MGLKEGLQVPEPIEPVFFPRHTPPSQNGSQISSDPFLGWGVYGWE